MRGSPLHFKRALIASVVVGSALLAGCQKHEDVPDALATVNGEPVLSAVVDAYARKKTGHSFEELSGPDRETLLRDVERLTAAAQAAAKDGMDDDPVVVADLELQRLEYMSNRIVAKSIDATPTEADLRAEFDAQRAAAPTMDFRVSHVLVATEESAKEVIQELSNGADFAAVAARLSKDSSRAQGGDLGWVDLGRLPKPLTDAIRSLKAGERFASPVRTDYGWHVVAVTETRNATGPSFESVRPQLEVTLRERREREYLERLLAEARIERLQPASK